MPIESPQRTTEPLSPPGAFEHLAKEGVFDQPGWLLARRRVAIGRFAAHEYPTLRQEDWRFTNVGPLVALPFHPIVHSDRHGLTAADLESHLIPGLEGHRLVFVDGHYAADLSAIRTEPGVLVASIMDRLEAGDVVVREFLGRLTEAEEKNQPFTALNTAFFHGGAFIRVEPGMVASPIHLVFLGSGSRAGLAVHVRNIISAAQGSRCTVVETHATLGGEAVLTNTVSEVFADDRAFVEHVKIQGESDRAFHIADVLTETNRSGRHRYHSIAAGAALSRTRIHTKFAGERVESDLNGLYIARGSQVVDHHMVVEHACAECNSHQHFNGILSGSGRGVFHGRIRVHPDAQKTDAKQTNRNLLLSDDASVNTKPQLEIYADDVKCTHGATVGQLSDESIFYLRSRGIGLATARRMLVQAFAGEIVERVECEPVRSFLDRWVHDRLEQVPELQLASDD